MGASYGQFCPIAKAMELLDERWTLLVVRELVFGSTRFNQLRRGLPRMSPSLLSKRLGELERAGLVERVRSGVEVQYELTEAGRELRPIVEALAVWGVRWIGQVGDRDLDPKLMMFDLSRHVDRSTVPDGRTVVEFHFTDLPGKLRGWWLVIDPGGVDVCDADPGHDITVTVRGGLRQLIDFWVGNRGWAELTGSGALQLAGIGGAVRAFPSWFERADFVDVPRAAVQLVAS